MGLKQYSLSMLISSLGGEVVLSRGGLLEGGEGGSRLGQGRDDVMGSGDDVTWAYDLVIEMGLSVILVVCDDVISSLPSGSGTDVMPEVTGECDVMYWQGDDVTHDDDVTQGDDVMYWPGDDVTWLTSVVGVTL